MDIQSLQAKSSQHCAVKPVGHRPQLIPFSSAGLHRATQGVLPQTVAFGQMVNPGLLRFGVAQTIESRMTRLNQLFDEYGKLAEVWRVAYHDNQVTSPTAVKERRGEALAYQGRVMHELFTAPEVGELLTYLAQPSRQRRLEKLSEQAGKPSWVFPAVVRTQLRSYENKSKLPASFVQEQGAAAQASNRAWKEAREKADFALFAPHLETMVGYAKQKAELLRRDEANLYDVLLNTYELGATTEKLDVLFDRLKEGLVPLIKAINESEYREVNNGFRQLEGQYPEAEQKAYGRMIASEVGFDFEAGRLDKSTHPYSWGLCSPHDVTITTRYNEADPLDSLTSVLHEAGHGMYEQGVHPSLVDTPIAGGTSLGIHESQSRFMENMIGRSRPFWDRHTALLKKAFPGKLNGVSAFDVYRSLNEVKPSFIRVEADEVTYHMHILLRYELEKAIINDNLPVEKIPEEWNKKMEEYLGIRPQNDADGCLQDTHWSGGGIGYFPTYSIGSILAAQIYNKMKHDFAEEHGVPGYLEEQIRAGEFGEIREWLRERIHQYGSAKDPAEIMADVTLEGELDATPFITYLWDKYEELYPDIANKRPAGFGKAATFANAAAGVKLVDEIKH